MNTIPCATDVNIRCIFSKSSVSCITLSWMLDTSGSLQISTHHPSLIFDCHFFIVIITSITSQFNTFQFIKIQRTTSQSNTLQLNTLRCIKPQLTIINYRQGYVRSLDKSRFSTKQWNDTKNARICLISVSFSVATI